MSDGQPLATFSGHNDQIHQISFSSDGKMLASCSLYGKLRLWRMPDGQPLATLPGHTEHINFAWEISFSPDGKLLAKSNIDNTITLWRIPDGQPLANIGYDTRSGYAGISFSPDSKLFASRSCSNIKLSRTSNGKVFVSLMGHTEDVNDVIFSPDGKLLVSSSKDRTIRLWQLRQSNLALYICSPSATLTGHNDSVGKIIFSPDGQILASCSRDSIIKLWSSMICLPVKQLCNHYREWVQKTLQDNKITEEEKNWLYFTQALMDWYQRFDVEVEDALN
jgi:WD40 repeat protein